MIKTRKVALIGGGAVGTSFLFSAMNRGLAQEYGIIDINVTGAEGNKLDLEDAAPTNVINWNTKVMEYSDLKDIDLLVITAGRPQKPNETRLDMIADNAIIMKSIANEVKESGFNGITIIASNPVDVLTYVFQKVTGFEAHKVIGSGTSLDSARLQLGLSKMINISPQSISAYVIGEHGDSSVSVFSSASVAGKSLSSFKKELNISDGQFKDLHISVYKKAYEIIDRKKATFYGIGSALANLASAILNDTKEVYACGVMLNNNYGWSNFYTGTPAVIGANGIEKIIEIDLNEKEKNQFDKSARIIKEAIEVADKAIEQ